MGAPMADTLDTRIAVALFYELNSDRQDWSGHLDVDALADAVIRELADEFVNFGAWLAEEITGRTMTRIDLESCLQEWKWLHDESRWLKGETDADCRPPHPHRRRAVELLRPDAT